jgi:hypothetical protein
MRPLVAHCHLGLGTLYLKTEQREQARVAIYRHRLYRTMQMHFWLPQAKPRWHRWSEAMSSDGLCQLRAVVCDVAQSMLRSAIHWLSRAALVSR